MESRNRRITDLGKDKVHILTKIKDRSIWQIFISTWDDVLFFPVLKVLKLANTIFRLRSWRSSENPWACWIGSMKCWRYKLLISRPKNAKTKQDSKFLNVAPALGQDVVSVFFLWDRFEMFYETKTQKRPLNLNVSCDWWWCSCQKIWC